MTPQAFIFHHTGGRGTVAGVQDTLRQRGLGVQYVMDRDGNITQIGGEGASHIRPGSGVGAGLSNANTVGMEVIAKDNGDVTPAQVAAAQRFIQQNYPNIPVYGHGEVNPGHKEADEGLAIVNAIRQGRGQPVAPVAFNSLPQQPSTPQPSLAFAPPPAQAPQAFGQPLPLFSQPSPQDQPVAQMAQAQAPPSFFSYLAPGSPQEAAWFNFQNPLG